jgi:hypothetical protein
MWVAAQLLLDVFLRTPTLVTPRPEPHVPLLVFRASALGVNQPAASTGLRILLEAFRALRVPDVVDRFLGDREELHGGSSILVGRRASRTPFHGSTG